MSTSGLRFCASRATRLANFAPTWTHYRSIHFRRELPYPIEEGLGDFLPPSALKTIAVDYQDGLLQRLNDEVKGTPEENKTVVQTVINTATDRTRTTAFNLSSLALNNSFFLDSLKPLPEDKKDHHDHIEGGLNTWIRNSFRSIEGLKSEVAAVANGMVGSGYVWVVTDKDGMMAVLPTFAAGTLLVSAREQTSPRDGSNALVIGEELPEPSRSGGHPRLFGGTAQAPASPTSGLAAPLPPPLLPPGARSFSSTPTAQLDDGAASVLDPSMGVRANFQGVAKTRNLRQMGESIYPLFCVSMHEHCWLSAGYGVWGKEEWLKRFWNYLDWDKVSRTFANGKRSTGRR